jgi:hypothetical protein
LSTEVWLRALFVEEKFVVRTFHVPRVGRVIVVRLVPLISIDDELEPQADKDERSTEVAFPKNSRKVLVAYCNSDKLTDPVMLLTLTFKTPTDTRDGRLKDVIPLIDIVDAGPEPPNKEPAHTCKFGKFKSDHVKLALLG